MFTEIKTQAKNLLASVKTLYLCCCNAIRHSKIPFKLKKDLEENIIQREYILATVTGDLSAEAQCGRVVRILNSRL